MNNEKEILLSICIPTYNRAKYLESSLLSIYTQIDESSLIEVIVSDNKSTDETVDVIQRFNMNGNFVYFQHEENVGMSKNIMKVVSLARGEFCWIIGDDDFIIQGAIEALVGLIRSRKDIDFYYAKLGGLSMEEYISYSGLYDTTLYSKTKIQAPLPYILLDRWEELIRPKYSVIFMGELMAGVFRRDIWNSFHIVPEGEFLSNLESSYVFCIVYANAFFGKKSAYITSPMILALDGAREWMDRLSYILIVIVKDMLDLYKQKGLSPRILRECYVSYIEMTLVFSFISLVKKNNYRDKILFGRYYKFVLTHPIQLSLAIGKIIFKSLKGNSAKLLRFLSPTVYQKIRTYINR